VWFWRIVKLVLAIESRIQSFPFVPLESIKVSILGRQIGTSNWLPNLYFDLLKRKKLSSHHVVSVLLLPLSNMLLLLLLASICHHFISYHIIIPVIIIIIVIRPRHIVAS
jgi:hypothetical protein